MPATTSLLRLPMELILLIWEAGSLDVADAMSFRSVRLSRYST